MVCGVVGCGLCVFWHRVSKWGPKASQMFNFWQHFHPILVQVGAKGDPKINTNNKNVKKRERKDNKITNRKLFERVEILLKTGGLNGSTFTGVL